MLDTNIVSDMMSNPEGRAQRQARTAQSRLSMSVIVAGELRFGIERRQSLRLAERLRDIFGQVDILPLELDAASHFALIRNDLTRRGTMIGANDLWIAAHARSLGATLVTDNVGEFSRVESLPIENWLRA